MGSISSLNVWVRKFESRLFWGNGSWIAKFHSPRILLSEGCESVENTGFAGKIAFSPHELGDPAGTRTPDLRLKRALLYQLSYWVIFGWDGWTRTSECGSQSPVPYHLATPQHSRLQTKGPERTPRPSRHADIWGG